MDMQSGVAFGGLLVAGAGFAAAVLFQNYQQAVAYGRLVQKVDDLKEEGDGHGDMAIQFASFKGEVSNEMRNQSAKMDQLVRDLTWLRQSAPNLGERR